MFQRAKTLSIIVLCVGLTLAIFVRIMNYDMRRDEQLYAPPAALLAEQSLYEDFFYNHVPGTAWLFRASYVATPGDHLLFSSRLVVFFGWVLFGAAVAWLTWRLTRSRPLTLFAALSLLANDMTLGVVGMTATNNFLPAPFAFLGLGLFILGLRGEGLRENGGGTAKASEPRALPIAIAGLCLSIAATLKVSAGAFIPPVALAAFVVPAGLGFIDRIKKVAAPLAAGGVIGAAPLLATLARAPDIFFAHVLGFHTGPHVAYWAAQSGAGGESVAMSLGAKLMLAFAVWFSGANLILLFLVLVLLALMLANAGGANKTLFSDRPLLLILAIVAFVLVLSFAPTPSFPQYFAPPILILPLLLALLFGHLAETQKPVINMVFAMGALTCLVLAAPRLAQHAPKAATPDKWTVNKVHRGGRDIAAAMAAAGIEGKVATLLPVYPLEGGLPVYAEFATGQFAYRLADITEPSLAQYYKTTSPTQVEALFQADPPAAILVGFEPALEAPFVRFAEKNGYRRVADFTLKDRYGDGVLFLKP